MQRFLNEGMPANKLLDRLPIEKRGIKPHTFGQLYEVAGRGI